MVEGSASEDRMRRSTTGRAEILQAKLAATRRAEDDAVGALALLVPPVLDAARTYGGPYFFALTLLKAGAAELDVGKLDLARTHLEEALAVSREAHMPTPTCDALVQLALLARLHGSSDEAERHAQESLGTAIDRGLRLQCVNALVVLGALSVDQGAYTEGVRLLAGADALRREIGMVHPASLQREVERLTGVSRDALDEDAFVDSMNHGDALPEGELLALARLTRGERNRPSWGWASLTPTELRVVELAVGGLTNRSMGEKLFISAGTVKTHLSHAYAKLGVTNRAELATRFSQQKQGAAN